MSDASRNNGARHDDVVRRAAWANALVRATGGIFWRCDPAANLTDPVEGWQTLTGQRFEQACGHGWVDAVHPDDRATVMEAFGCAVSSRDTVRVPFRVRTAQGAYAEVLVRGAPVTDERGEITEWVGTIDDLSSHGEYQARLRQDVELSARLSEVSIRISGSQDSREVVQIVTDECRRLSGAAFGAFFFSQESAGEQLYEQLGDFPVPSATPLFGPTFRGEEVIRLADARKDPRFDPGSRPEGRLPVTSYLAVPVITSEGEVMGGFFFGHPEPGRFTEQHERLVTGLAAKAASALQNTRLIERLKTSEERAREAAEAARAAERRKDEFLAMLGHELRNPLAPMVTALELLRLRGSAEADSRELGTIRRQVDHLRRLVDDLLDISRITRGKLRLAPVVQELGPAVRRGIELSAPAVEERGHHMTVEVPRTGLPASIDRVRLAQVVANLVSNAARYTDPGGRIAIQLRRESTSGVLTVSDTGIGMEPETISKLFEPFVQARRPGHGDAGLGLGLTIVRSMVELHGGTVSAHSDGVGKGTTLEVRLPLVLDTAPTRLRSEYELTIPQLTESARKVLVVDDNRDAADGIAAGLVQAGFEVRVCYDGPTALREATSFGPQVALLDIGLPVMTGYELAGRLREQQPDLHRLVAVTGYGQLNDREQALAAGFDEHLVKPVTLEQVFRALIGLAEEA